MRLILGAFCFGFLYSIIVVRYYQTIGAHDKMGAAFTDLLLGLLAVGTLQAWEDSGRKPIVLLSEVVGMSVGSYLAV